MQMTDAGKLRKMNDGENCKHINAEKEYYLGAQTGDYACRQCGETFSSKESWLRTKEQLQNINEEK